MEYLCFFLLLVSLRIFVNFLKIYYIDSCWEELTVARRRAERSRELHVIVPAFNEANEICRFVDNLLSAKFIENPKVKSISIVFNKKELISDSFEGRTNPEGNVTTWDAFNNHIKNNSEIKRSRLQTIIYDGEGGRAGQIKYCIDELEKTYEVSKNDYYLLMDVDSHFNYLMLEDFLKIINSADYDLVQIPNFYFTNKGLNTYKKIEAEALAILQNYFIYSQEIFNIALYKKYVNTFYKSCFWITGNCVGIKKETLDSIGGYPVGYKLDDMAMSILLNLKKCSVHVIKQPVLVPQVNGLKNDIKQKAYWYNSYFEFFTLILKITRKEDFRLTKIKTILYLALFKCFYGFKWLLRPIVILGCIVTPFYFYVGTFKYVGLLLYFFYIYSVWLLAGKYRNIALGKTLEKTTSTFLLVLIFSFFNGLSPWLNICNRIFIKRKKIYLTVRL